MNRSVPNTSLGARTRRRVAGREPFSRNVIVSRVLALIEGSQSVPLHLSDLCSVTGVSERTLRTVFREYFGMSPKKYLRARKLHEIRSALSCTDGRSDSVSSVAARFGLSDAGRMARDYRDLFGEYPGMTLMQALRRRRKR